ncbi:hypothetical protein EIN_052970 [Entamoeba invadens IP1]|uniref:hypothetical protein n=1 Tax=Entamoeba invadens IP1 TaxID=370355 RepID=UPI0002C3D87B|nr:hypothetical protein EIN_052970 [Entamoeba invadens IP1]ELP93072.1 hypothetical protein EIN_052970 [Entamoeba invadens IP1]|eukprot:XP_004259843.1 hypothetical protein EIN_052970 [Entamoeba invadens IP1]
MLLLTLLIYSVYSSEVYRITPKTFDKVTTGADILIRFCPMLDAECRSTQSSFEGLADSFEEYDDLAFGEFDCSKYADFCDEHNLSKKWPLYVAYTQNENGVQLYPWDHDVNKLSRFIYQVFQLVNSTQSYIKRLTNKTFDKYINDVNKQAIVLFYTYTCYYGREQLELFENIATGYGNEKDLVIAAVECTFYKDLCDSQNAKELPELKKYSFTDKLAFPVRRPKDQQELSEIINKFFMKDRDQYGNKPDTFGTFYEFDKEAVDFIHQTPEEQEKRIQKCREFIVGNTYVDIMRKIQSTKSMDFIDNEIQEIQFHLSALRSNYSPAEIDDKQRRLNVLRKFL